MDIDKLVEQLQNAAGWPEGIKMCQQAATALSTIQSENEKIRDELEQVKRERDAAVKVIERVRSCKDCGHYTGEWTPPCKECQDSEEHHPYFKWRGQKED